MRYYFIPEKIIEYNGEINDIANLMIAKDKQIGLNETSLTNIDGKCRIVLDFGKEMRGGLRIIVREYHGDKIRIRLGESLVESLSELGVNNSTNDGALRDDEVSIISLSDENFFNTGFRFATLDFPENSHARIKNIYAFCDMPDKKPIYLYKGKDECVKKIFDVAKRTIDLCSAGDYVWDGVKRDRLVWAGDLYPEMLALTALYGVSEQIEYSLNFVKNETPLPGYMNGIPTYSMWWLITLAEYHRRTGRTEFVYKQKEYIEGLCKLILSHIDKTGMPDYGGYFIDWQTTSGIEENCGGISLVLLAIKSATYLYGVLGIEEKENDFMISKIFELKLPDCEKKQIIALKYFAFGNISEKEKNSLLRGGASGLSTFMSFAVLKTIAETVSKELAIDVMKEYFGAMLKLGATTFWEDFDYEKEKSAHSLDYPDVGDGKNIHADFGDYCFKGVRHSLCHGWSAGVIDFIKTYC